MQWLISIAVAGVACCAILAVSGFRGRPDTVGIDLGTTYSVIALRTLNRTDVLPDALGRALIPSAVYFQPGGDVLVGYDATAHLNDDPKHVIYNAKRFIGRSLDDEAVVDQARLHPFDVVGNASESTSGAWFRLQSKGHPAAVSPESVGTHVLRHLLDVAAWNLGHRQISRAVVAVPAKFNGRQRQATVNAYKAAGLKVMRIIDEPTAAAVAYGLDKKPHVDHIVVYDFGGGTLDVSLLFVNKQSIQVLSTHGDDQLGGADFDHCIVDYIVQQLGDSFEPCEHPAVEPCAPSNVRGLAERAKKELSSTMTTSVTCAATTLTEEGQSECQARHVEITRGAFEATCASVFDRVVLPVTLLLEEADMSVSEVDEVVLVGGTSRIPRIRELLREKLQVEHLNTEIDPDVTVALGAASIVD